MRRLLAGSDEEAHDARPALLAVVALMLLLLPMLLLATSPQKLTAIALSLAEPGDLPGRAGIVERVAVRLKGAEAVVEGDVRQTDVLASEGQVETRQVTVPSRAGGVDYAGVQDALRALQRLDPQQRRVLLLPDDAVPTEVVVALIDAARGTPDNPLFVEVVLGDPALEDR